MMRLILFIFGLFLSTSLIGRGIYTLKKGFSPRRLQPLEEIASPNFSPEAKAALEKSYRYLGRGRQCFAFVSDDDRYVLKFPRTDIYATPFWLRALPLKKMRNSLKKNHQERQRFILESFRLANEELHDQTGMIAYHMGKSDCSQTLTVIDALGCKHRMKAGKTSFVLQHKQPLWTEAFLKALDQDKKEEAKLILNALIQTIAERASKSILNRDRSFLRNYGFDGKKAYQIDVGSFFKTDQLSQEEIYSKSVRDSIDPIQEWLNDLDPEMLAYLNHHLDLILKN